MKKWQQEEDRYSFSYKGYPCLILRNHMGALCGYVGVTNENNLFGKKPNLKVHGDVTFAGHGDDTRYGDKWFWRPSEDIEGNTLWWIGFDCTHFGDYLPKVGYQTEGTYKDVDYVIQEIEGMVDQIIEKGERSE